MDDIEAFMKQLQDYEWSAVKVLAKGTTEAQLDRLVLEAEFWGNKYASRYYRLARTVQAFIARGLL
jgi:hypothetical protein